MKKNIFIISLFLFFSLVADTITPEIIADLSPDIPFDVQEMVNDWIKRHPDLLEKLIPVTENTAINVQEIIGELKESMQELMKEGVALPVQEILVNGTKIIIPRNSYIIALPEKINGKFYVMAFSGPWHKLHALESYNGKGYHVALDAENDKKTETFQTVTQAFHALKCKEIIEQEGISTFDIPEVYLMQVPDRPDIYTKACDENSVIVRKFYEDPWLSLQYNLRYVSKISPKQLEDLYKIMKGATLHFVGNDGNLMMHKDTYQLAMRDFQGPNDQNPKHPFNGAIEVFSKDDSVEYKKWHSVTNAVCGLSKLLEDAQEEGYPVNEQIEALKNNVARDKDLARVQESLRKEIFKCAGVHN